MPSEQIGAAFAKVSLDSSSFESGLGSAKSAFTGFAGDIEGKIGDLVKDFAKLGVATATAFAVLSVKEVADYQGELYNLGRTSQLTGSALKEVTDANRNLSMQFGQSRDSLDAVSTSLAMIAKTPEGLKQLTQNVAELAQVSGSSNTDLATLDTTIGKLWGEGAPGIMKLNDAAIALKDTTGANEEATLNFVAAFGPLAQTVGVTDAEAEALGATFQQAGVDGTDMIQSIYTGTNTLIKNIDTYTSKQDDMTKGTRKIGPAFTTAALEAQQKLGDIGRVFGETGEQIKKDLDTDYVGTLIKLGAHLRDNAGDTEALQAATELFGARGVKALMALGDKQGEYAQNLKLTSDNTAIAGDKQKDLGEKANEIWTKINDIINTVKDSALSFGEAIEPILTPTLNKILQWGKDIDTALRNKDWKAVGDIIGGGISQGIHEIINTAVTIGTWIEQQIEKWGTAGGESLGKTLGGWIGDGILQILGVNGGFGPKWLEIGTSIMKGIDEGISNELNGSFLTLIKDIGDKFFDLASAISDAFVGAWNDIGRGFTGMANQIVNAIPGLKNALKDINWSQTGNTGTEGAAGGNTGISMSGADYQNLKSQGKISYNNEAGAWQYNGQNVSVQSLGYSGVSIQQEGTGSWEQEGEQQVWVPSTSSGSKQTKLGAALIDIGQKINNAEQGNAGTEGSSAPNMVSSAETPYANPYIGGIGVPGAAGNYVPSPDDLFKWNDVKNTFSSDVEGRKNQWDDELNQRINQANKDKATTDDDAQKQENSTKKIVNMMTEGTITSANTIKAGAAISGQTIQQYSGYAANSIKLGAEVGAKFTTDGGNAVQIGLTASGQQIAVIGQVAQKNFADAGGKFVGDTAASGKTIQDAHTAAGVTAKGAATDAGVTTKGAASQAGTTTVTSSQTFQDKISSGAKVAMDAISKAGDPAQKLVIGAQYAAAALVSAGQSLLSMIGSRNTQNTGNNYWNTGLSAGGNWLASGTETSGPELALIGEEGKEFVIPTKQKRWDLLYAAMRAYGIRGFAEGGDVGSADSGSDVAKTIASITLQWDIGKLVKDAESKLKNLLDYFKTTWLLIQSQSQTAWINIKSTVIPEANDFEAALINDMSGIRTSTISTWQAIVTAITTQVAAIWPTISPNIISVHDNVINSFSEIVSAIATLMDSMKAQMSTSLQGIVSEWGTEFTEITNSVTTMTTSITGLSTQLNTLIGLVNQLNSLGISLGGSIGGGGSGGSSNEYMGMGSEDNATSGSFVANPGDITDMTCTGPVSINTLHYTSPTGESINVNPMTYLSTGLTALTASVQSAASTAKAAVVNSSWTTPGGVATSQGSVARYGVNAFGNPVHSDEFASWGKFASGGLIKEHSMIEAGESGPEMVLPTGLTRMFLNLADAGLGSSSGNNGKMSDDHIIGLLQEALSKASITMDGDKVAKIVFSKGTKILRRQGGYSQ